MEVLESDNTKNDLLKRSVQQRENVAEDIKLITERTQKFITNGLIIGGVLVTSYILISQLTKSKEKSKLKQGKLKLVRGANEAREMLFDQPKSSPGIVSQIGTALATQAALFLLGIAKEKLNEYLNTQNPKEN